MTVSLALSGVVYLLGTIPLPPIPNDVLGFKRLEVGAFRPLPLADNGAFKVRFGVWISVLATPIVLVVNFLGTPKVDPVYAGPRLELIILGLMMPLSLVVALSTLTFRPNFEVVGLGMPVLETSLVKGTLAV